MKKILWLLIIVSLCLGGCITMPDNTETPKTYQGDTSEYYNKDFKMEIDNTTVDIDWEDNTSVKELIEYAKKGLTITMHQYGGFEQVGAIGKTITSNDTQMATNPGDVVLYSSNQIVIFFGSNKN